MGALDDMGLEHPPMGGVIMHPHSSDLMPLTCGIDRT